MKRAANVLCHSRFIARLSAALIGVALVATFVSVFKATASIEPGADKTAKSRRISWASGSFREMISRSRLKGQLARYLEPLPVLGTCDTASLVEVEATAGTVGPTGYSQLGAAFIAINAGTHQGTINIEICGNTIEGIATLNASGSGAASYSTVSIKPVGGVARTISGLTDFNPLINLNGADDVTIDGLNTGGNSLTISNSSTSNNSNTSTIRFVADATNNTIQNCTISGSATSTSGATIFFGSGTTSGNDGNIFSNNSIGPAGGSLPQNAIYSQGTSAAVDNSGITISGNNIFDFQGNSISTSVGVSLSAIGNSAWTITNNKIFQTGTRTYASGNSHAAIRIRGGDGYTISGNTIGFASAAGTGTYTMNGAIATRFDAIDLIVDTTTPTSVQNNTIAGFSLTTTTSSSSGDGAWCGINIQSGNVNVGTTTGNTIGSTSGTGSLSITSSGALAVGINSTSSGSINIQNTSIGSIDSLGSAANLGPSVIGIQSTGTGGTYNISNNTIGNTTANNLRAGTVGITTGSTSANGIVNSATGIVSVSSNTIRNLTSNGTGTFGIARGIENFDGTVSGNSISSIISASRNTGASFVTDAAVMGIAVGGSSTTQLIESNTISGLRSTAATANTLVTGIGIDNSAFGGNVRRNKIFDLTNTSTGTGVISGLHVYQSGASWTASNNMISLTNGANTNAVVLRGIYDNNAFTSSANYYFNSVIIGGSASSGSQNSYAFWRTANTTVTLRDNILVNTRTGGTGKNYAIANGTFTPANGWNTSASNFNVLNSSSLLTVGLWGTTDQSFAAWKSGAASGGDANSYSGVTVTFVDAANGDLKLNLGATPTLIESGGTAAGGITIDQEGDARPGPAGSVNGGAVAPDIGADEFDGVPLDLTPPTISYTPLPVTASTSNRSLSATITDLFGVASGGNSPRVYYSKNGGSYASTECGAPTDSVYPCTIDNSLVGGVVIGDVISYFVIAQDTSGNVSSNPSATPNSYNIVAAISGLKTVCASGCDYTTLTGVDGIFADINTKVLTANLEIQIAGDLITGETGVNALNALTEEPSGSNFTIRLYPTDVPRAISGESTTATPRSLLRLDAADRVTIDGSIGGTGTDRSLTIINSDTSTLSAVVWIQSNGSDGATDNSIKNLNVSGNGNTQTLFGIGMGSNTIGTSSFGSGNNANTIQNNSISKTQYGIYSQGASAGSKNTGNLVTENLVNTPSPNNVKRAGILVGFEDNIQITRNNVSEIASNSSSEDVFGISLGTTSIGTLTYSGNTVTNANVSRNVIGTVRQTAGYSACGIYVAPATSGTNQIANNAVAGVFSNASSSDFTSGILIGGGAGSTSQIYFNSVSMNGTQTGINNMSFALAIGGSNPIVDIRNNVLYNTQTTTTGNSYAVGLDYSTFTNLTSNYNDLFVGAGATLFVGGTGGFFNPTNRATLLNLQTATGKDTNSISSDPLFSNPTSNLQPQLGSPVLDAGTSLSGSLTPYIDISGATRVDPPTMGAYEAIAQPGILQFSSPSYSNNETNADHTFSVVVTRTGGSGGLVSVNYAVTDGTATVADNDYSVSPASGTLNWADGSTTDQTITISIKGDTTNEPNETINLALSGPTGGATIGVNDSATLTIINDEGPTAAPASISGQIVSIDGQPLSGVTITVTGGPRPIRAITDSGGFYRVESLETGGFYVVTPSRANYAFAPANISFSLIASRTNTSFAAMFGGAESNPLESPEFFVRQNYVDFLGREPDQGGLDYWSDQLRACGTDLYCLHDRRIGVSAAFFVEREFQDSGLFIYDLYQSAFGRRPEYAEYSRDKKKLNGGSTLETDKTAFARTFVEGADFIQQYPLTMTADVFVDALLQTAQQSSGVDLSSERAHLLYLYNSGANATESRSLVVRSVAEGSTFKEAQYNSAFVLMEYFGYLGRDPDQGGYDFWLNVLNDRAHNNYRAMVCAFLTSAEYQLRFGANVTRTNQDCGP